MKKLIFLLFIIIPCHAFSQINSPNGDNIFTYNGLADVIFRFPERGTGGRALVHYPNNILSINYGSDFTGGTLIGNDVYFKDGGNSYIASGNFGIGTDSPTGTLELRKLNSNLVFDLNTSGICKIISKGWNANIDLHTYKIDGTENFNQLYLSSNGQVGFGTSQPTSSLSIGDNHGIKLSIGNFTWANTAIIQSGYNYQTGDFIDLKVPGHGANNAFIKIVQNGNVGIGTISPDSKLTVAGNIHVQEVKVTANAGTVPDYVFANDYKLQSLDEVELISNKTIICLKFLQQKKLKKMA